MPTEWDVQSGPKTLRGFLRKYGWRGPQGPSQRALRDALREFSQRGEEEFSLKDIMASAELDYDDKSDYSASLAFLSRMRRVLVDASEWFWELPEYKKYVDDGFTDKTVFKKLVEALRSHDIYPIYFDEGKKNYGFLTLEGLARLIKKRALAMRNEFLARAEELAILSKKFPALREMYAPPALSTDGRFIELPASTPHRCGKCNMAFVTKQDLSDHNERRHPEG